LLRRLFIALSLFSILLAVGTIGYTVIEKWPLFEAFYMTVITLSTVGFGEIKDLSKIGRIFTSFLIIGGVGAACYGFSSLTEAIVSGQIAEAIGEKKNEKCLKELFKHYIICGYGRVGKRLCELLQKEGKKVVVIESSPEKIVELKDKTIPYVFGNAVEKEFLLKAGVDKAVGVFASLPQESDNIYITLLAKSINPSLRVVARGDGCLPEEVFKNSGVDTVVSLCRVGAKKMFLSMLRPNVIDFIEEATLDRAEDKDELLVEDLIVRKKTTLESYGIKKLEGVYALLLKKMDGTVVFGPSPSEKLEKGDVLVVLGQEKFLKELQNGTF